MAPELLVPSMFGLGECIPSKAADIYAVAMVIHQVRTRNAPHTPFLIPLVQVLTGMSPFGIILGHEVAFRVCGGGRPSKPPNAPELGLSGEVWKLLEDSWQTERTRRPPAKDVLCRIKTAALVCGTLPSVGDGPKWYEDPEEYLAEFGRPFLYSLSDKKFTGFCRPTAP